MSNKPHYQSGMTLIELIVAIVIIAVGLAGVLSVFNTNVRASADPMVQKQLLAIAEGMMDEVMLLPYAAGAGTGTGCVREAFDDIGDFAAYTSQPICDLEGNTVLSGYSVSVAVVDATLGMELTGETSKKITVTVERNANESVKLIGWRTNWAQ
jgi:MSHA pilin protein MshD